MLAPPSLNFGLTLRNENRYPKRRGFCPCSSASCVPDQTWRFIGGIDTDTISRNSALRSAVPKKFFFPAEHQSEGGHDPSKAIRARFSPAPITGEARSNRCGRDIYIYVSCESCRLERIYLSQFGRPQPPKVPVLSVGANVTNFLENFLGFSRTMQVFFIDNWDLVVAADVWILEIADLILSWVEKIFSFLCISHLVMKLCI